MPTFDELQSPANILTEIQHGSPSDAAPKTPADKNPFDILSPPPTPSACYSSNSEESSQELSISSNCEHPLSPSDSVVLDPTNPSLIQTLSKPVSLEKVSPCLRICLLYLRCRWSPRLRKTPRRSCNLHVTLVMKSLRSCPELVGVSASLAFTSPR